MEATLTYAQLDRLLGTLGFTPAKPKKPAKIYEHANSEMLLLLAKERPSAPVRQADLISVRRHLVDGGFLSEEAFDTFMAAGSLPAPL